MKQITITWHAAGDCKIHYMPDAPSFRGDKVWESRLIGRGTHEVAEALRCAAFQMSVPEELSTMLNKELELRRKENEGEPLKDLRPGDWFTYEGQSMMRTNLEPCGGIVGCVNTKTGAMVTLSGERRVIVDD